MDRQLSREFLVLLSLGLVAFLVTAVVAIAVAHGQVVEAFWAVDPDTGLIVAESRAERLIFVNTYERRVEILWPIFVSASICIALIIARLHSVGRACQARLALAVLPVLAPVLLTLGTALLARRWTQDTLERIHKWISDEALEPIWDCFGSLTPCSRLLAFDTVFSLAPMLILGVTAILLVPAMVAAWRAGAGARLGKGWSRVAIVCFLLGATAMVSTRAHRADRAQVLATCAERDDPEKVHWVDTIAVADWQGVEVEPCSSPPAWAERNQLELRSSYRLSASGELFVMSTGGRDLGPVEPGEVFTENDPWWPEPEIALYVDARTPMPVLEGVLEAARDAKVEVVLLLGTSTISGQLATRGAWRRRVQCGLGVLRFADPNHDIREFERFAELAAAASLDGGLHLELGPS